MLSLNPLFVSAVTVRLAVRSFRDGDSDTTFPTRAVYSSAAAVSVHTDPTPTITCDRFQLVLAH